MFITARQIDDLHRSNGANGHVALPYRARLTPLAADWVRARKIVLGYADVDVGKKQANPASTSPVGPSATDTGAATGAILWWCDGPCGPAKAAMVAQSKESPLRALDLPANARQLVPAVKALAGGIHAGTAAAGVLLLQTAAAAMVFANRCPSLRAIVGTCQEAVEQGIQQVAANVLVIEYPYRTLHQVKSMVARFAKAKRDLPEDVRRQLQELGACV